MFCAVLADWCLWWNFAIQVNAHSESRHEFLMLLKLQYHPARWIRLVEAMVVSHFIKGTHTSLINEFPFTQACPFKRFLKWQWKHNPQAVALDEDLQRAIICMEMKKAHSRASQRSRDNQDEDDDDERPRVRSSA